MVLYEDANGGSGGGAQSTYGSIFWIYLTQLLDKQVPTYHHNVNSLFPDYVPGTRQG